MPTTLIEGARRDRRRVVIAGGGVAALETLLALTEIAPDHVAVQLVAPQRELTYRPLSVAEPFRLAEPQRVDLARVAADRGAQFQLGTVKAVAAGSVRTEARERIPWDALMLAVGTQPTPALTGALSFGGNEDVAAFRALLDDLAAGRASKLAFVVPRGVGWTLPLYELALMTAARCAGLGIDAELHLATVERRPLELFGLAVSDHVATLLDDAGIALRTAVEPLAVHSGRLILAPYGSIAVDRAVALPRRRVPYIAGVPRGPAGFIPVDDLCRVQGRDGVYAAGDATWHPIKQGGLATQQADAASSAIAAAAGAPVEPQPFEPVLRGVLLTGGAPEFLRGANGMSGGASENALWWPPAKVAGRYLGPYLAGIDTGEALHDVVEDHHPALELALQAADAAAGWRDYDSALRWLAVAERLNIVLPPLYAEKRVAWRSAAFSSSSST